MSINKTIHILTYFDCIKGQDIAEKNQVFSALCRKNICTSAKTVVILHPQSGLRPEGRGPVAERTLTTMPQDKPATLLEGSRRQQTRQGDTEQSKSPVNIKTERHRGPEKNKT